MLTRSLQAQIKDWEATLRQFIIRYLKAADQKALEKVIELPVRSNDDDNKQTNKFLS